MNIRNRFMMALLGLAMVSFEATAGPAFPLPFKAKTAEGKEIEVRLIGDEHFHYYLNTATNEKMLSRQDGLLFTATEAQLAALQQQGDEARAKVNTQRKARAAQRRAGDSTHGDKRGLVILVNYQDVKMSSGHGQERWNRQFNEEGYSNNGHIGSVRDYFRDQSYGQLNIDFDVVGPYTLSKERAYYGSADNAYSGGHDAHPCEMVAEACWLAAEDVDFSNYDWNGDGEVDQVFVIYAGGGEHAGAGSDCIWPHEFSLSGGSRSGDGDGALHINNVRIDTYAVSCERYFTTSSMDAIGAACHEFSHCLGLMDIYDTSYSGNHDMDDWDVLSSGSYNGSNFRGNIPVGYTAFERYYVGWLTPIDLTESEQITDMPNLGDEPVAYFITNPGFEGEVFVLENRQSERWFQYPSNAHGLMIYHIDWDNYAWWSNTMNSGDHSRVSIVPADNDYDNDFPGDLFPGTNNVITFDDKSHEKCGGKLFNKNTDGSYYLHNYVTAITETDGKINFRFVVPTVLKAPTLNEPTILEDGSYHFKWNRVSHANSYQLEIKRLSPLSSSNEEALVNEDFDKLTTEGTTDVSAQISKALNSDGWSGYHVYSSKKRVRIGTQVAEGYLQTPLLHTANGEFTVGMLLKNIGTGENETFIQAVDADGVLISQQAIVIDGVAHYYNITIPELKNGGDCYLRIYATTRAYLDDLCIYDGCWYDDKSVDYAYDENLEEDTWKWNDEKIFTTSKISMDLTDADIPGYGYYRCQVMAKSNDGANSSYSTPVYILNKRPVEDGITTIVTNENSNSVIYDLQGRRTRATGKGLYIRNGRKYIVR